MKKLIIILIIIPFMSHAGWLVGTEADLRMALNSATTTTVTTIEFNNDISAARSLELPHTLYAASKQLHIYLNGYELSASDTMGYLLGRTPVDNTEALNVFQSQNISLYNGQLNGKNKAITLLKLSATFNSTITTINVKNATNGLDLQFCMNATVSHCMSNAITYCPFIIRAGTWPGAGLTNAGSNGTTIDHCRIFPADLSYAGIQIVASDGTKIEHCIIDYAANCKPFYGIYCDAKGSSVVKEFTIDGIHAESDVAMAMIYINSAGGYVHISHVYTQKSGVQVWVEGINYPHVYVEFIPYLTGQQLFRSGSGVAWYFREMPANRDLNLAAAWSGTKPANIVIEQLKQAHTLTGNSVTINGNLNVNGTVKFNGKTPVVQ